MGAGESDLDLTGKHAHDFDASIKGGVGDATVLLPGGVGVKARAEGGIGKIDVQGLTKEGYSYVKDAYGTSDVTIDLNVQGGSATSTWRWFEVDGTAQSS